ncbi:RNA recognition motif domain-containing protein [Dokdonella ginsengisoli]|uniref:RNA recognition motif domain-containing protein n=1 Tax=Dokdonella ginsengisoli TaxID=363846 RepID=A0ABV9QX23_9GAMM
MITIDVRGLPRSMTESALQALFANHGKVFGLRMSKDLFNGECKGFAELKMEGHEARQAIAALDGSVQEGSALRVSVHSGRKYPRR